MSSSPPGPEGTRPDGTRFAAEPPTTEPFAAEAPATEALDREVDPRSGAAVAPEDPASGGPAPVGGWSAAESVLRAAVCAFDDRTRLPADTHTLDALVSAMKRRQWLSTEESLALHAALRAILPDLRGRPVLHRRATGETGRPVRRRPECVPALLAGLPAARARPDPVLDELTEALTTPAGVRTDRAELRAALESLVTRAPRPPALDAGASLQQYEIHLIGRVHAAQGRIAELVEIAPDVPAGVLWVLLDTLRDSAWRGEASLASLRGSVFSQLRLTIPALVVGPRVLGPDLDPVVAERITAASDEVVARLRAELADVWDGDRPRAADLVVDALSALSGRVLGGEPGEDRVRSAVTRLREVVARAMADDGRSGRVGGSEESRRDRTAAAQETIDELARRIRTAPTAAGLTFLVAEAFAELLERFDVAVHVDDLGTALRLRWPDG